MKKRSIVALLVMLFVLSISLAACGGNNDATTPPEQGQQPANQTPTGDGGAATEDQGAPHNITMAFLGQEFPDQGMVWDAINEIMLADLNMTFDPIVMGFGDYVERLNLMLAGGTQLDVFPIQFAQAAGYVTQGQVVDLSELIWQYGQGIIDFMGEEVATGARIGGVLYGIPSNKESASLAGIVMRNDIVEELNIDMSTIQSQFCLTPIFEQVKAAHPHMTMIMGTNMVLQPEFVDQLIDGFGVLGNNGQSRVVENWFEMQHYRELVELVSYWYQRGFVLLDAATTTETASSLMQAGQLFSYMSAIKPGFHVQEYNRHGHQVATAFFGMRDGTPVNNLWSSSVHFINWGIATNTTDAARAMQFLNWAYTSPEFNNLLNFGIYGIHHVSVPGSDIWITFPDGIDNASTGYHLNMGWHLPNQFLGHVWYGRYENTWELYQALNDSASFGAAFGFLYDPSAVATERVALTNVTAQFRNALETGSAGARWEQVLDEFNTALWAAGLQNVIDEKQRQLDEFWAFQESN